MAAQDVYRPVLLSALLESSIQEGIPAKSMLGYYDGSGVIPELPEHVRFIPSGLKFDDIKILVDNNKGIITHINDTTMHWSAADRRDYAEVKSTLNNHVSDVYIHITQNERNEWNGKETEAGAQAKANVVQTNLEVHAADLDIHTTKRERDRWNNTYTREEVANMVSTAQSNSEWKRAVNTFDDLAIEYPNPKKGWICTVLDTMITYSYNDEDGWVPAFINTMPLATNEINGLLSAELHAKLVDIEEGANLYIHPDHMNCRHVTDLQIKKWDNKADKSLATIFQAGLMSTADKDKLDSMERNANFYTHPEFHSADMIEENELKRFVTDKQIQQWSNPVGIMASETTDGAMSKADYIKLLEIEEKANYYVHPAKHSSTDIAQDKLHRFVTDEQIRYWNTKEDTAVSQARADQALQLAKEYTDKVKSDIVGGAGPAFDTLKELADALGNDANLSVSITQELSNKADKQKFEEHCIDYSTHLDKDDRLKLNSVSFNANNYIHPDTHPAEIIQQSPAYRMVTDNDIYIWNSKAPGTIATASNDGIMSKEMAAKLESLTATGKVRSDWTQTDELSDSFILHKPTEMKAKGGDSDTVGGYTVVDLRSADKPATVVIGHSNSGYTDKSVDFICDGTNDAQQIMNALDAIPVSGGTVFFKEGTYTIKTPILLDKLNTEFIGHGVIFKNGVTEDNSVMINLSGINNTIRGIVFDGTDMSATGSCIYITGNINTITNCKFKNGAIAIRINAGNSNKILANDFNMMDRGVIVEASSDKDCYGTIVTNNSMLTIAKEGILLMSSLLRLVSNTVISNNTILDAYTGVRLTNEYMTPNTVGTIITNNSIQRGTGQTTDYLYEQRTVYIEYASRVIVTNNMLMGRDVFDKTTDGTNIIKNNIFL